MKKKYFRIAQNIAKKSNHKHQHGAVLVYKNQIIGLGYNKTKTSPKATHPFKFLHAEIAAIFSCQHSVKDATMYIYRELACGKPGLSRPCPFCLKTLKKFGIKKICYSIENGYKEEKL